MSCEYDVTFANRLAVAIPLLPSRYNGDGCRSSSESERSKKHGDRDKLSSKSLKQFKLFLSKFGVLNKINFDILTANTFTLENKRIKKKEAYWLLEEARAFNKLENLVILEKYM
mgnify:CR=1 FL=1